MKPFWAYMLRCSDGSYYVGHTDELERRIAEHEAGAFPGYTSQRRPVMLVWSAEFASRDEALVTETHIKGWSRRKKAALIRGDWDGIKKLARGRDRARPSTPAAARPTLRTSGRDDAHGPDEGDDQRD